MNKLQQELLEEFQQQIPNSNARRILGWAVEIYGGIPKKIPEESLLKIFGETTGGISGTVHGEMPSDVSIITSGEIPADILGWFVKVKSDCILGEITGGINVEMFGKVPRGIHKEILGTIPSLGSLEES